MFCSKCGNELEKNVKFCPHCGTRTERGEADAGEILKSVSSKAKDGASYAAEQIKQIDVNDMKGIFTNVTKTDSIVYLIAGVVLLLVSLCSFKQDYPMIRYHAMLSILSLMVTAFLCVYFFITMKITNGVLSSSLLILGITTLLSLLAAFHWLPYFLNIIRLLICMVIGVSLAVVGGIRLRKDIKANKPAGGTDPSGANNFHANGAANTAGATVFNMNAPIANYNPKYDYTPIGMWGYFLYQILFFIPVIGWICWIVFALGGTRNINLRNFARSYLCIYILILVVSLLVLLVSGGTLIALFH